MEVETTVSIATAVDEFLKKVLQQLLGTVTFIIDAHHDHKHRPSQELSALHYGFLREFLQCYHACYQHLQKCSNLDPSIQQRIADGQFSHIFSAAYPLSFTAGQIAFPTSEDTSSKVQEVAQVREKSSEPNEESWPRVSQFVCALVTGKPRLSFLNDATLFLTKHSALSMLNSWQYCLFRCFRMAWLCEFMNLRWYVWIFWGFLSQDLQLMKIVLKMASQFVTFFDNGQGFWWFRF